MNKNFKVRAVFSDVDGTLLNSSHRVTPRTGEWIHRLADMEIPFVIVSARSPSGIYPIMRRNDFECALIAYSGALIMDRDRKILFSREIERGLALKIEQFFEEKYGFKKCILTTSGTDALEMAAILCDVKPGDEVIVPSYTFVSSALAFVRQGAKIVFADSCKNNPNIDADKIETLITDKTKVIVPVHYAGVACDMDKIMDIADRHDLFVVEDAALWLRMLRRQ